MIADAEALQKALDLAGDGYTVADVLAEVLHGDGTVNSWHSGKAWIITRLNLGRTKSVHFWAVAGEKEACLELSDEIMRQAKQLGCTKATMLGRKGWTRVLKDWKQSELVVMEREL